MHVCQRLAATIAALGICVTGAMPVGAQSAEPKLNKAQRATLEAVITAVDRAALDPTDTAITSATWISHVLRASDGSHYIALRADVPGVAPPRGPVILYARLATRRDPATPASVVAERSAVLEWLKGRRGDPLPMRAARSTTVNAGEMPIGGTAAAVGDVAADATSALRLGELRRERETRMREDEAARRKAMLEKADQQRTSLFPFEDFDAGAQLQTGPAGHVRLLRSVTAGPGDYDLLVGWVDPASPAGARPQVVVVTQRLRLPPAPAVFGLSDIVVAEDVVTLSKPYSAMQQAGHPYAFGGVEVVPAPGNRLVNDGTLGLVYQVVNASGTAAGKPDVEVTFQLHRMIGNRLEAFGRLEPQRHRADSLPEDFDVALGHPLFGAVRAPLATFPRGRYRIDVTADDRLAGRKVVTEVALEIKGSPTSLLREAPTAGQAFRREQLLTPIVLASLARALAPGSPSPPLARALAAAEAGRFAELVQVAVTEPSERPLAQALLALGLYGLGDSPRTVATQLTQAVAQGAPAGPVRLMLGATSALLRDDAAAVAAWNDAREEGMADTVVSPMLVDAYLRRQDVARAAAMATAVLDRHPGDTEARQALAMTHIATRRYADALDLLDATEAPEPADGSVDFLRLHALFAAHVVGVSIPDAAARFERLAGAYVARPGLHAALVQEWLAVVSAAP